MYGVLHLLVLASLCQISLLPVLSQLGHWWGVLKGFEAEEGMWLSFKRVFCAQGMITKVFNNVYTV